jgi:hypothetical protein
MRKYLPELILIFVFCTFFILWSVFIKAPEQKPHRNLYPNLNTFKYISSFTINVSYGQNEMASCLPNTSSQFAPVLLQGITEQLKLKGYNNVTGKIASQPDFIKHPLSAHIRVGLGSTMSSRASYRITVQRGKILDTFLENENLAALQEALSAMSSDEKKNLYTSGRISQYAYSDNGQINCQEIASLDTSQAAEKIISSLKDLWQPNTSITKEIEAISKGELPQ